MSAQMRHEGEPAQAQGGPPSTWGAASASAATSGQPSLELELVVARYEESLSWLRKVPAAFAITVYDKGASAGDSSILPVFRKGGGRVRLVPLPNVGREAHSYLHHIASCLRGDGGPLAEVTVFCQGRPFDHAFDFHATLRSLASKVGLEGLGQWRWLGHTIDTDTSDGALFRAWSKNASGEGLDLDGFHLALTGEPGPPEYAFVLGGQFSARRAALGSRGLAFWESALELSASWPHGAHCFERAWNRALGLPGPDPAWMAGRRTIHLKRMKHGQGID